MKKISSEQRQEIFGEIPNVLRSLVAERDAALDKLASYEMRNKVEKLASKMVEKGLESGSVLELADRLEKQASTGQIQLQRLTDAVELVGPNMGKFAHLSDDELDGNQAASAFEQAIFS